MGKLLLPYGCHNTKALRIILRAFFLCILILARSDADRAPYFISLYYIFANERKY